MRAARKVIEQCFGPLYSNALPADLNSWVQPRLLRRVHDDLPQAEHVARFVRNGAGLVGRLIRNPEGSHLLVVSTADSTPDDLVCSADEARLMNLTYREIEVLRWVEHGMANTDIATLCDVSVRTVHKHLQHVFEKLNVENRMAAVRRVRDLLADRRRVNVSD